MRILVHGGSIGPGLARLRMAARGLAARGHELLWRDAAAAVPEQDGVRRVERIAGLRADLVIGGGPVATAIAGWRAGADGMMLGLEPGAAARWTPLHHWCWESLHSFGLIDAGAEPGAAAPGLEPDRLVAWSEAEPPAEPDPVHPDVEILERAGERMLASRSGSVARPAVFLDRDGTLVEEKGYLDDPAGLALLPGVPEALRTLSAAGFALVVVSNQSGVGRGYFPLATAHATMAALRRALRGHGVELDAIYFCPHRPDERCACRKPGPLLLQQAMRNLRLDLKQSFVVGDKRLDVATAHRVGAYGVLVRTGYGREEESRIDPNPLARPPERVSDGLAAAAEWIIERRAALPSDS